MITNQKGQLMLTTDTSTWPDGEVRQVWAIEFDTEYGSVQAFGRASARHSQDYLESGETGGCYSEPQAVTSMVEVRSAEEHFLAVFDSEEAMTAGAHIIATAWAATLPATIWLALIAPQEDAS
jgi:hypothetical protein